MLLPFGPLEKASAETSSSKISIQVTYAQSEARKVLEKINTSREAASAAALVYDYGLEKEAMQRAAELAVVYLATRPDGTSASTIHDAGGSYAETELYGVETAGQVFDIWYGVESQKNVMLSVANKYVGISRVTYNGRYYWAAVYSDTATAGLPAGAYDGKEIREITVDSTRITPSLTTGISGTLYLNVNEYYDLSKCSATAKVTGHEPSGESCPLTGTVTATSSDPSIIDSDGGYLIAKGKGKATVTISCAGLSTTLQAEVSQPTFDQVTIDTIADQNYTGYEIRPNVTVRLGGKVLALNTDYTLLYSNNVNKGTGFVTITGKGAYSGTKTVSFQIVSPTVSNATVSSIPSQSYTGYAITPAVTVYANNMYLRSGIDYTVSYSNNVNMGTANATIIGIGNYTGTKTVSFQIVGPGFASAVITAIPDQLYTGQDIRPAVTVTLNNVALRQYTDYDVSYSNNRNIGTATVTVTGRGNYAGTKTITFRIVGKDISNAVVSSVGTLRYTGEELRPAVTVKIGSVVLRPNIDYMLSYRDNRLPGTASIEITGMDSYSGSKTVTFKIAEASLYSANVTIANQKYTGKEKTPKVTVELNDEILKEDRDYEVEYRNNIRPGKATAVISGIGDYNGTKKVTFVIVPKAVIWRGIRARSNAAVLSWNKDSYAAGYEVYRSKKKASGYKRIGTLKKNTYTGCTNTKLSRGTYYYKVRSYVVVDGKRYSGAFSAVKSVKI